MPKQLSVFLEKDEPDCVLIFAYPLCLSSLFTSMRTWREHQLAKANTNGVLLQFF